MRIARACACVLVVMLTGCSAGPGSPSEIPLPSLCAEGIRYVAGTLVVEDINPPGPDGLQVRVRVTLRALNVVPSYVALHWYRAPYGEDKQGMTIEAPCDGIERTAEHVWEGRRWIERLDAGSNYTLDGLFSDRP